LFSNKLIWIRFECWDIVHINSLTDRHVQLPRIQYYITCTYGIRINYNISEIQNNMYSNLCVNRHPFAVNIFIPLLYTTAITYCIYFALLIIISAPPPPVVKFYVYAHRKFPCMYLHQVSNR